MYNFKWLFVGIILLALFAHPVKSQRVELSGTEVLNFTSAIDGQQYILHINLPNNYAKTNKKYPVLFVTDGQWFFPSMYVGYGGLHYDGFIPDLIIVGITWPDDYDNSRKRDFSPEPVKGIPNSGNAGKFLEVVKNEIIKLVVSKYRIDENDKALFGTSLGGVFAIYTLFHEPSLFNRYIIISPALEWDNGILFRYEERFAEKKLDLKAKIFISSGEYEEAISFKSSFNTFVNQLKSRNYKELQLKSMVIDGMGHSSSATVGGIIGLQYIYSKPALWLENAVLDKYIGHYTFDTQTLLIGRSGNFLYLQNRDGNIELFAETPSTFYIKGFSGSIQFKKDQKNNVSGFDLIKNDTTIFYKKTNQ